MKKVSLLALMFVILAGFAAMPILAQSSDSAASADKTPPSYDLKPQALLDFEQLH